MDFSDSQKTDENKKYAGLVSAAYAYHLIKEFL